MNQQNDARPMVAGVQPEPELTPWDKLSESDRLKLIRYNGASSYDRVVQFYNEHQIIANIEEFLSGDKEPPVINTAVKPKPPVVEAPVESQEHIHVTEEPAVETTAPVSQPEPVVEAKVEAPVHTNEQPSEEIPPLPESPEEIVGRQFVPGSEDRPELLPMSEGDRRALLLLINGLTGAVSLSEKVQGDIAAFFEQLKRHPTSGAVLYKNEQQEERDNVLNDALFMLPPRYGRGDSAQDEAVMREGVKWGQRLSTDDGKQFTFAQTHPNEDNTVLAKYRRRVGAGTPVTMKLVHTGIVVKIETPTEDDFCEFDLQITRKMSEIGMQTYGMLLNAASGVYIRELVNFAIRFVSFASFNTKGRPLKDALLDVVDERDYWLLICGLMIAKFPTGIPWTLSCLSEGCDYEEPYTLNIARSIRAANSLFTSDQRAALLRLQGSITPMMSDEDIAAYQAGFPEDPSDYYEDDILKIKFKNSSLFELFDSTEKWVNEVNERTVTVLSEQSSEAERNREMNLSQQQRRLTRYMHRIDWIAYKDEEGAIVAQETDRKEIHDLLKDASTRYDFVNAFEAAIAKYNETHRLAIFGYRAKTCPKCGNTHGEQDGAFRGFITLSPDRVFFTLSRVVSEIQRQFAAQYESIG